jgi:type I restriction enzyme S subunit
VVRSVREGVTPAGQERSVLIPEGTLILTNSATVGLPKVIGISACIHDGFLAFLDLSPQIDQTYLYVALLLSRDSLVRLAPHGTQKNLNTTIVKGFEVPLPSLRLQRAFGDRVRGLEEAADGHRRQKRMLDVLFASLRDRAFKGEL